MMQSVYQFTHKVSKIYNVIVIRSQNHMKGSTKSLASILHTLTLLPSIDSNVAAFRREK